MKESITMIMSLLHEVMKSYGLLFSVPFVVVISRRYCGALFSACDNMALDIFTTVPQHIDAKWSFGWRQ